jgi:hypothetical protein
MVDELGVLVGHGERTRIWVFFFGRAFWLRLTLMNNDLSTIEQLAFSRLYTYSVFVVWNVTCDKGRGNVRSDCRDSSSLVLYMRASWASASGSCLFSYSSAPFLFSGTYSLLTFAVVCASCSCICCPTSPSFNSLSAFFLPSCPSPLLPPPPPIFCPYLPPLPFS